MAKKSLLMLAMLAISILIAPSCATRQVISTAGELDAVLKAVSVGESRDLKLLGTVRPYSGAFFKGMGLSEISVGGKTLLISSVAVRAADAAPHLNKVVAAHVKISHFPLRDSDPASQIAGHWITEIIDIKPAE